MLLPIPLRCLLAACLPLALSCAPAPPAPPPPPAPELGPSFPYAEVWTARPGVPLDAGHDPALRPTRRVSRPLTRLEVLGRDSTLLRVRCRACAPGGTEAEGYVRIQDVLYEPEPLAVAAWGDAAGFGLALRAALLVGDRDALRSAMAPGFSFSFVGPQGSDPALRAWQAEGGEALELAAALLDQGLATRDSLVWAAPPDFYERLDYHGLRLGIRRTPEGRWEWVFLIRGEGNRR